MVQEKIKYLQTNEMQDPLSEYVKLFKFLLLDKKSHALPSLDPTTVISSGQSL